MERPLNIEVRDSIFDPNLRPEDPRRVYVREQNGQSLYKVWVYLSGYDLPYVKSTTYILHSTFSDPVRRVRRTLANPNCQLVLWTWGLFEIRVKVEDKANRLYELVHMLNYDKELSKPGIEYIYEKG